MTASVAILMGSESDLETMRQAATLLGALGIPHQLRILSAHRTPAETAAFVQGAPAQGVRVFIAGAGAAAHLAGTIAAQTTLPVIGVPLQPSSRGGLGGLDALLATVQMPRGVPVATVAIGGAENAALLAAAILALSDESLAEKLAAHKRELRDKVLAADARLQKAQRGS